MIRKLVAYVPDTIFREFLDGAVSHFEYGDPTSVAVYADGRKVEFDSRVTEERLAEQREKIRVEMENCGGISFPVRFESKIDRCNWKGVITGWTE